MIHDRAARGGGIENTRGQRETTTHILWPWFGRRQGGGLRQPPEFLPSRVPPPTKNNKRKKKGSDGSRRFSRGSSGTGNACRSSRRSTCRGQSSSRRCRGP